MKITYMGTWGRELGECGGRGHMLTLLWIGTAIIKSRLVPGLPEICGITYFPGGGIVEGCQLSLDIPTSRAPCRVWSWATPQGHLKLPYVLAKVGILGVASADINF